MQDSEGQYFSNEAHWKLIQKNTFTRWINEHLKIVNKQIANIDTDLSDGLRLISLVEVLSRKSFLKFNKRPTVRTQMLENVTMALKFLQNVEKIKIVNIDSSDIVDHNTKLILGLIWMLILHYSISTGNWDDDANNVETAKKHSSEITPKQRLLNWIQGKISDLSITNFTTNWNNGKAIGALVDGIAPGLCPDWDTWKNEDSIANAREAMEAAEQWLDVPQLIKPEEMCSGHVDELSIMTYLSQFPNAKLKEGAPLRPKTNPARVRVYGPGLEPNGVKQNRPTEFTIETFGSGSGNLNIQIRDALMNYIDNKIIFNDDKYKTYTCEYTPKSEGTYKIEIKFADRDIPKSPFLINVSHAIIDVSKVAIIGAGIQNGVVQGQITEFVIKSKEDISGCTQVEISDPENRSVPIKMMREAPDEIKISYQPMLAGSHVIKVLVDKMNVGNGPFKLDVLPAIDISKFRLMGRGIQNKGIRVGDDVTFFIKSDDNIKSTDFRVLVEDNKKQLPLAVKQIDTHTLQYTYKPDELAILNISASYHDKTIGRSPYEVLVQPRKQCKVLAYGPGLITGFTDYLTTFTVNTNDEDGTLGFSIEGPSQARINCHDNEDGTADVSYITGVPGEYVIHVLCDEEDINNSPFIAQIISSNNIDVSKITIKGPALDSAPLIINRPTFFSVINNTVPPSKINAYIYSEDGTQLPIDVLNEKYTFKPVKNGKYVIYVTANGVALKGSPFKVMAEEASMPDLVKVYGQALNSRIKTFTQTSFIVDCSLAGQGDVEISLSDNIGKNIPITTNSIDNRQFKVEFFTGNAKNLEARIYFGNVEIPLSPLFIQVHPSIDLSGVKIYGLKNEMYVESPHEISIDVSSLSNPNIDDLRLFIVSPLSEKVETIFTKLHSGLYSTNIIFTSAGPHEVEILYNGLSFNNSPFSIKAIHGNDPKSVKVFGPGLTGGNTLESLNFTVDTRGAGQGGLDLSIEGPCEAKMTCRDNRDGTCSVEYLPVVRGLYDITVKFSGFHVPGSPFSVNIEDKLDASKVNCIFPPKTVLRCNSPFLYSLDTSNAGEGILKSIVFDPRGKQLSSDLIEKSLGKHEGSFLPTMAGTHKLNITYANIPISGSPFNIDIANEERVMIQMHNGNPNITSTRILKGDKLDGLVVNNELGELNISEELSNNHFLPVEYIVPVGPILTFLKAIAISPSGKELPVSDIIDNRDGTAIIKYSPTEKGHHILNVTYNNIPISTSPFRFEATEMKIGEGVVASGSGLIGGIVGNPIEFFVNFGNALPGGFVITIDGPAKSAIDICDLNTIGSSTKCRVIYYPQIAGEYILSLRYAGLHINGSPFKAKILPLSDATSEAQFGLGRILNESETSSKSRNIQVYGPGITEAVKCNLWNEFHVNYKNAGKGSLKISIDGPSKVEMTCTSDKDHISCMQYKPDVPGLYVINVLLDGEHINGSPFLVNVRSDEEYRNSSNITEKLLNINAYTSMSHVGKKCTVNLQLPGITLRSLKAHVQCQSSGSQEKCRIEEISSQSYLISFIPKETGVHFLHVNSTEVQIPGNPFQFFIGPYFNNEQGRDDVVKVTGSGLSRGKINVSGRVNVDARISGSGDLCISMEGPEKPSLNFEDILDGTCDVTYLCSQPGNYFLTVKLNGIHALGSPFSILIQNDDSVIPNNNVSNNDKFLPNKPAHLKMKGTPDDKLNVRVLAPNGKTVSSIIQNANSENYIVRFIPRDNGIYSVHISQNGSNIPGSPFQLMVGQIEIDPKKVVASGDGLTKGKTGEVQLFEVDASATGPAPVLITIDGPSKAFIECLEADEVNKKFKFSYTAIAAGIYRISIVYGGDVEHINGSPFKVQLTGQGRPLPWNERSSLEVGNSLHNNNNNLSNFQNAEIFKINCHGTGLSKAMVNQVATFHVDTPSAKEMLMIGVVGPSGPCTEVNISKESKSRYAVNYRPSELGLHLIGVQFGDSKAPGSPFKINVK